jgi:hypothetical protein
MSDEARNIVICLNFFLLRQSYRNASTIYYPSSTKGCKSESVQMN